MTQRDKLDPNSQGYTNALLEDLDGKFQAILEATAPIPEMQKDLAKITDRVTTTELRLDTWESSIKLIPTIFEEVGSLRKEVNALKEELKLLNRHDERLDALEQRLIAVEQQVR